MFFIQVFFETVVWKISECESASKLTVVHQTHHRFFKISAKIFSGVLSWLGSSEWGNADNVHSDSVWGEGEGEKRVSLKVP